MSKVARLREIYTSKGLSTVLGRIFAFILVDTPLSPYLKNILGELLHQKLWIAGKVGYWPHIRNPRAFNEKLLYRKLFTDNSIFAEVEDKYRVREFVTDKVGDDVLPDLYYVTENPQTIPFDELPLNYVIKPTHLSDSTVILVDEEDEPDHNEIIRRCRSWLDRTHGEVRGEYWYKDINPQIIVEERLTDETHDIPLDYKFWVFHGEVKSVHVTKHRHSTVEETTRTIYDRDWNAMDVEFIYKKGEPIARPDQLDKMVQIAETLGEDFDHIRVDLYAPNDDRVVFGEMTVAESSGASPFVPREYDFELGSYW